MEIDGTLAKGLTKQLISWWGTDVAGAYVDFAAAVTNRMKLTRNGYQKQIELHEKHLARYCLTTSVGGSKRKPYIASVVMGAKERGYKGWEEDSIHGRINIFPLTNYGHPVKAKPAMFAIGEHAISRIYQRSGLASYEGEIDPYIALKELVSVPVWANYWLVLLNALPELTHQQRLEFAPIIPTPRGLLLGKVGQTEQGIYMVEIRTYVQESALRPIQSRVRAHLLKASQSLESSLLCIYPFQYSIQSINADDELSLCAKLISYRLQTYWNEILEVAMPTINAFDRKFFESRVLKFTTGGTPLDFRLTDDEINQNGYRDFVNLWVSNKMRLIKKVVRTQSKKMH